MKENTRNRIIGGVFVVALLVILVPMLFDEPSRIHVELEPLETPDIDVEQTTFDEPDPRPVMQAREEVTAQIDDQGFLKESGTKLGEPVLSEESDDTQQWAVQLVSLSNKLSAEQFRSRLEGDGHRVWISNALVNENERFRVVMGPFLRKQDAESKREELNEQYDIDGILVNFDY